MGSAIIQGRRKNLKRLSPILNDSGIEREDVGYYPLVCFQHPTDRHIKQHVAILMPRIESIAELIQVPVKVLSGKKFHKEFGRAA